MPCETLHRCAPPLKYVFIFRRWIILIFVINFQQMCLVFLNFIFVVHMPTLEQADTRSYHGPSMLQLTKNNSNQIIVVSHAFAVRFPYNWGETTTNRTKKKKNWRRLTYDIPFARIIGFLCPDRRRLGTTTWISPHLCHDLIRTTQIYKNLLMSIWIEFRSPFVI